jgi:hypothetical protein
MLGIALAGMLATSLGSPNAVGAERRTLPAPARANFAAKPTGLTAKLQVAALETGAPKLMLREGVLDEPAAAAPAPELIPAAHEEVREPNKAWLGAGIAGGAVGVGVGAGLIAGTAGMKNSVTTGWAVGASTALVGGLGGYFLGKAAGEGSVVAQIAVLALDTAAAVLVSYGIYRISPGAPAPPSYFPIF